MTYPMHVKIDEGHELGSDIILDESELPSTTYSLLLSCISILRFSFLSSTANLIYYR
jgi:hypothetical protein